ncbi:MAG: hypothetical protein IJN86_05050 [Clostridia bacterium]|nr:hypothetical protein [Clostridia bacterium]
MNYTLLSEEQAKQVRQAFEKAFIETPEEYMASCIKWREEYFSNNPNAHVYPLPKFDEVIYWSKIKCYKEIAFAEAISFLSSISNPVYFMSDLALEGYVGMHLLNDPRASIGFVAVHDDPKSFAEHIYDEWKCYMTYDYENEEVWFEPLLPEDLYVFDDSFSWMLVFTHHNVDDFMPEPPNGQNRGCFIVRV